MVKYFGIIKEILIKNGFSEVEKNKYSNDLCTVYVVINNTESYYVVEDGEGSMYSETLEIYWLIGVLVYNGYIKNYIKVL